jgi:ATP-dependent Clp protease protease subunit
MSWFHITHKNGVAHANIFAEIGVGSPAESFIAELRDAQAVELRLDCPGGDSKTGIKIHDALRQRNTTATITGRCGSAGLIACMGSKIITCISSARLLVHQPVDFVLGNAGQFRFAADGLNKIRTRFEQIISDRTKQPLATVRAWVAGETYFSAAEALAAGLIDEIFSPPDGLPSEPTEVSGEAPGTINPATETEKERMFRAFLETFGEIEISDRDKFWTNLNVWLLQNVKFPPPTNQRSIP